MRKWVLVGLDKSLKSTISDWIEKEKTNHKIRLDVWYRKNSIEIPGSYLEINSMNNSIIMICQNQARGVFFILDGATLESIYPPNFAKSFTSPSYVLVSKSDLLTNEDRDKALKTAGEIGASKILFISFATGEGLGELKEIIEDVDGGTSEIYYRR